MLNIYFTYIGNSTRGGAQKQIIFVYWVLSSVAFVLLFFPCVFLGVSSNGLCEMMNSHNDCIFWSCHSVFSSVSLNGRNCKMNIHTGCTCPAKNNCLPCRMLGCSGYLYCVFSNVSSNDLCEMMYNHNGCICLTFHCVFSSVSSNHLFDKTQGRFCRLT